MHSIMSLNFCLNSIININKKISKFDDSDINDILLFDIKLNFAKRILHLYFKGKESLHFSI